MKMKKRVFCLALIVVLAMSGLTPMFAAGQTDSNKLYDKMIDRYTVLLKDNNKTADFVQAFYVVFPVLRDQATQVKITNSVKGVVSQMSASERTVLKNLGLSNGLDTTDAGFDLEVGGKISWLFQEWLMIFPTNTALTDTTTEGTFLEYIYNHKGSLSKSDYANVVLKLKQHANFLYGILPQELKNAVTAGGTDGKELFSQIQVTILDNTFATATTTYEDGYEKATNNVVLKCDAAVKNEIKTVFTNNPIAGYNSDELATIYVKLLDAVFAGISDATNVPFISDIDKADRDNSVNYATLRLLRGLKVIDEGRVNISASGGGSSSSSSRRSSGGSSNGSSTTSQPVIVSPENATSAMTNADKVMKNISTTYSTQAVALTKNAIAALDVNVAKATTSDKEMLAMVEKTTELLQSLATNKTVTSNDLVNVAEYAIKTIAKSVKEEVTSAEDKQKLEKAVVDMANSVIKKAGTLTPMSTGEVSLNKISVALEASVDATNRLSKSLRSQGMYRAASELYPVLYIDISEISYTGSKFTGLKASATNVGSVKKHPKLVLAKESVALITKHNANLDVELGGILVTLNTDMLRTMQADGLVLEEKTLTKSEANLLAKNKMQSGFNVNLESEVFDIKLTSGNKNVGNIPASLRPLLAVADAYKDNTTAMAVYNEDTKMWQTLPTMSSEDTLFAYAPHFSKYAVVDVDVDYSDIAGNWAEAVIENMSANGIVAGRTADMFEPNNNITRAEFAAYLVNMLGLEGKATSEFNDVDKDAWYYNAVGLAADNKLVSGIGNGNFAPEAFITRQDMAVMLATAYKAKMNEPMTGTSQAFVDNSDISEYAKSAVAAARYHNLVGGFKDGTFKPLKNASRAEATQIINNLFEK